MKTFITDDFLLHNEYARELYHEHAKDLPVIDYHNHLPPNEIEQDRKFENITQIWLQGDHYKWRLLRANGVEEKYITGNASDKEKFIAWAQTVPNTLGNPLYHWTHMELLRYFGIDELLDEDSAEDIWNTANERLQDPGMSTRNLLAGSKVEFVGTTDDPVDDLKFHQSIAGSEFSTVVAPSFRPDQGLDIGHRGKFKSWVDKLGIATGREVHRYSNFLEALADRVDYFDKQGCRASDHGINVMFYEPATEQEAGEIFEKSLNGDALSLKEVHQFKTHTLQFLAERYEEKNWAMQLHIGPMRNNNSKMFEKIGPDSGFDTMGDQLLAEPLSNFLDSLEQRDGLPKTILYCLNPRDNYILATMAGNFQNATIPGKVQFGTAWWYNDHIDGMENQMNILANVGLIKHFLGMLTDSRSFLSFSRHEYFRRILCNLIGSWAAKGTIPANMKLLGRYVEDISYYNAKRYFNL
ncbi:glucuronate isomerase [Halobacillus massiliensis]|uniref:glucuronate isomerase n=1 Tax=Halobacillus massiliensis TaxID=1926286 RepID=UPI0009E52807|nr:glucuronate isomerase [Halobacillus massiliensis]